MSMTPPRERAFRISSVGAPLAVVSCSCSFIQGPETSPLVGRFQPGLGRHHGGALADGNRLVRQTGGAAEQVGPHERGVGKRHQPPDQDAKAADSQHGEDVGPRADDDGEPRVVPPPPQDARAAASPGGAGTRSQERFQTTNRVVIMKRSRSFSPSRSHAGSWWSPARALRVTATAYPAKRKSGTRSQKKRRQSAPTS